MAEVRVYEWQTKLPDHHSVGFICCSTTEERARTTLLRHMLSYRMARPDLAKVLDEVLKCLDGPPVRWVKTDSPLVVGLFGD